MSYGFSCTNDDDEIVIDSEYKAFQLFDDATLSGTFDSTYNLYFYPADNDSLVFFEIPVGGYVGKTHTGQFISSESTLSVRYLRVASEVTTPDAYGLKVFDAFGDVAYSSEAELDNVKEAYRKGTTFYWTGGSGFDSFPSTLTFNGNYSENVSESWYAITAPVSSTFGGRWQASVIFRETSSVIHGVMRPYASAPSNILSPEPFWFLTA